MTLTVGSLFSGIGGLELGLERAGMKTIWQCEREPFARAVLAKNFPGVPCYDDVTQLEPAAIIRPDVLCGGFPCQPHSYAGRRQASEDERDLWPHFLRLIRGLKPRWVLAENVPGLLSSEDGRFFGRVLRDLAESGLDAEWSVLPACAVGASHPRERVFVVAYPNGDHGDGRCGDVQVGWQRVAEEVARARFAGGNERCLEPALGRVAHGVPDRLDSLKALGNAVYPEVAEVIGAMIMQAETYRAKGGTSGGRR